jgi:hypothetical protein
MYVIMYCSATQNTNTDIIQNKDGAIEKAAIRMAILNSISHMLVVLSIAVFMFETVTYHITGVWGDIMVI